MDHFDNHGSDGDGIEHMSDEAIRELAYRLWEEDGQPEGLQDEYWYRAQRQLEAAAHGNHHAGDIEAMPEPISFIETTTAG